MATAVRTSAYDVCRKRLERATLVESAATLTALLVLFHGFKAWYFQLPARVLALASFIFQKVLFSPYFWAILAILAGLRIGLFWHDVDNHKFLLFYWLCCMSIVTALRDPDLQETYLLINARFFLVLIMLGAVAQKGFSHSYMDSSFFEFTLLEDSRFSGFIALFGIDTGVLAKTREFVTYLENPYVEVAGNSFTIPVPPRLAALAAFVTWYDLLIQLVIGIGFAVCHRTGDLIAHLTMLLFIVTAYFAAPVIGFAWLLIILGFLLAKDKYPDIALAYILCLAITTIYEIPWRTWVT